MDSKTSEEEEPLRNRTPPVDDAPKQSAEESPRDSELKISESEDKQEE